MTTKLPEGFPNARTYYGRTIQRCLWADNPHGGEWFVQTYHKPGNRASTPWSDEECPHYQTLAEAKVAIREDHTQPRH
jgi:hypothetical protein